MRRLSVVAPAILALPGVVLASDPKQAEKSFKDGLRYEQNSQWKEAEAALLGSHSAQSRQRALLPAPGARPLFRWRLSHALEDATAASALGTHNGEAFQLLGDIDVQLKNPRQACYRLHPRHRARREHRCRLQWPRRGACRLGRVRSRPWPTTTPESSCVWIIPSPSACAAISTSPWAAIATP